MKYKKKINSGKIKEAFQTLRPLQKVQHITRKESGDDLKWSWLGTLQS